MKKLKKTLLTIILIFCVIININAQKYDGVSTIGADFGMSDFGYISSISYRKYLSNTLQIKPSISYENSNKFNMTHYSLYANGEVFKDFFNSINKNVILFGGGASVQYENVDITKKMGDNFVRTQTNAGVLASINYECYLLKNIMIGASATFNYNVLTKFAPTKFWGGININYVIK